MGRIWKKSVKKGASGELICSPKEAFRLYKRAVSLWRQRAGGLFLFTGLHAAVKAVNPYCALYFTARLLNEIAGLRRREELFKWVLVILAVTVVLSLLQALLYRVKMAYESAQWNYTQAIYADKILNLDFCTLDDPKTYELFSQIEQAENWAGHGLPRVYWHFGWILEELFKILGAVALSVSLFTMKVPESAGKLTVLNSPVCILVLLLCILGTGVGCSVLDKVMLSHENQIAEEEKFGNRCFWWILDFCSNQKRGMDIRLYEQEKGGIACFQSYHFFDTTSPLATLFKGSGGLLRALSALLPGLFMGIVYLYVCLKAWAGAFGIGMVTQYVGAVTALSGGMLGMMTVLMQIRANAFYLRELFQFLDIPNDMYQGSLTVEKRSDRKYEIEFRDVSFRYPGSEAYVLHHVSMKFQVGQRLAVVGQNGSGKTTFIKLLCRLYDPTEGVILLNGIDIRKYNYREYLSVFSVVFQDFQLLSLPLSQNVAASKNYDEQWVLECLKKTGLEEMLHELPKGLDTSIGKDYEEGGIQVSGGQGQKIAIARSLYKDAAFIILDEPTAALDPVAEYEIYTRFNEIVGDRTAVYISHRLSSCRFCDEIIVFHEGSVIQQGSHEKLLSKKDGKYAELWNAQAKYYTK